MACEVMAIQEPTMLPMQLPTMQQDMTQPRLVAMMLVPAAMMMPQPQVSPVASQTPSEGYAASPWGQDMQWPAQGSMNYQAAENGIVYDAYDYNGAYGKNSRRRKPRHAQPKAPGMVPNRYAEEPLPLDANQLVKLRERFETANMDQSSLLAHAELLGWVWPYSRDPAGCRAVQSAIVSTKPAVGKAIAQELHGHVREAAESPHANYVLEKVIEQLSSPTSAFIADELLATVPRFARHRFGCRIVCRLVEHCSREESTRKLIQKLLEDPDEAIDLCRHNFGHHVVQSILEHGDDAHKEMIAQVLLRDVLSNASHRSSSYVVEAALKNCSSEDQDRLVQALLQPGIISELAKADFGSYVVRTLLKHPKVDAQVLIQTIPGVAACLEQQ